MCNHVCNAVLRRVHSIRVSVAQLPALRCNRKCIQNDLDARRNAWIEFFSIPALRCIVMCIQIILYALPVAMQRRQSRYARSCVYCEPAFTICSVALAMYSVYEDSLRQCVLQLVVIMMCCAFIAGSRGSDFNAAGRRSLGWSNENSNDDYQAHVDIVNTSCSFFSFVGSSLPSPWNDRFAY